MLYQAVMNIGGKEPKKIASGLWESSAKAFEELRGMSYWRIPTGVAWCVYLTIKSNL